jgi:hypothetical protein
MSVCAMSHREDAIRVSCLPYIASPPNAGDSNLSRVREGFVHEGRHMAVHLAKKKPSQVLIGAIGQMERRQKTDELMK